MSDETDLEARRAWFDHRQNMRRHNRDAWDAEYKALMGERVAQTPGPSMNVIINTIGHGRLALALPMSDPIHPRIDTVCERAGHVQVIQGIPSAVPQVPHGYGALAHIRVPANAASITTANIEGANT